MNENLIDRYLLNLLNQEEKRAFEEKLKSDKALFNEMSQHKELIDDIEGIGRLEMKEKLQNIHNQLYPKTPNSTQNLRRLYFRIAAAAIFIGVLSIGFWWMQQAPTPADLYAQNFEPFELSLTQRSEEGNEFKQIESLYSKGNFKGAIPLLENVINNNNVKSSQLLMGLGVAYLQTGQPNKAITQFKNILETNDFNFEDEAQWYLGLSYLKLNDIKNAKIYLGVLASDAGKDHHQAAHKILSQLD